jgi:hypothetical protein
MLFEKKKPSEDAGAIVSPSGDKVTSVKHNTFELLIHDAETDLAIIKTVRDNTTALRSWVGSIGNAKTRDVFKAFLDDLSQVTSSMSGQKKIILNHLAGMNEQWKKQQIAQSAAASEPTAPEPSSAAPEPSSAAPAAEAAPLELEP